MGSNVFNQDYAISKGDRRKRLGHNSFLILFTGLSGSGKSSIANRLEKQLYNMQIHTYALDGDNIRQGICKDLNFYPEDRNENLRRIGEISKLMIDAGVVTIAAFVSPYKASRKMIQEIVGADQFVEVYVSTPLEVCEKRDVKGLYAKARAGEIKNFTGISSPYEVPENPDVTVNTESISVDEAAEMVLGFIKNKLSLKAL